MTLTALFDGKIGTFLMVLLGLGVLALLAWLLLRGFGRGLKSGGSKGRASRLGIVDAFDLDRHRQLVIIRRDNVEHLIMIGGPNDLVIEDAIVRPPAPAAALVSTQTPSPGPEPRREPQMSASAPLVSAPVPERAAAPMPAPVMPRATPMPRTQVPPPEPAAEPAAPDVEASKTEAPKQKAPPRLSVNINSLEEEMSRLLGRAPEKK